LFKLEAYKRCSNIVYDVLDKNSKSPVLHVKCNYDTCAGWKLIFHSIEATEIKKTAILQNKTSKLETRAGKFVARKQANRSNDVSVDIPIENSVEESTPFDKTTDLIQTSFDETPPQKRKSKKK